MKTEENNWSAALLKAHFQSMNQEWSDQNSVMLLLSEIGDYLKTQPAEDTSASLLLEKIQAFTFKAATRLDRQPMKTAGKRDDTGSSRKTG